MGLIEFQVILMAGGKGSRMTELTTNRPKCLLPVGNLPMIWYPLQMLERSGFEDAIVVVMESVKNEVQAALDKCALKIRVDLAGIPLGEDWGTAESLRYLEETNKIKSDSLVVMSCDLISNVQLGELFNVYRRNDATVAALFFSTTSANNAPPPPGPKTKDKPEKDLVGVHPETNRLLLLASASDYEDILPLSKALLRKHGQVRLHTGLLDAHLYIIKRWLTLYLVHNRSIMTLKGELLPYVVKKQTASNRTKTNLLENPAGSVIASKPKTDLIDFLEEVRKFDKVQAMSSYIDHHGDRDCIYHGDKIRCYAHIADGFATRANTLQEYCRINRELLERWPSLTGGRTIAVVSPSSSMLSTQLENSLVAEKAVVAEKTSIKNSFIGAGASVETRSRIANCVIMPGARIEQGCALNNCIVCDEAVVGTKCDLKDCLVGSHHVVPPDVKHANEVLTDLNRLMEI